MSINSEHAHNTVRMGSDRGFGLVFSGVFILVAVWPLTGDGSVRLWALLISVALSGVAFIKPAILKPFNVLWFKIGLALGRIVTPIALGIIFFGALVPTGMVLRLFQKDPLSRAFDHKARSYWIVVEPGSEERSMKNQF